MEHGYIHHTNNPEPTETKKPKPAPETRRNEQVLRRPASREQAQALTGALHTMAMDLQDRELKRLDTVRRGTQPQVWGTPHPMLLFGATGCMR